MEYILTILGKVGFDWRMALFNLVNFMIVFAILKKFAFGPIGKVLDERHKKVIDSVNNIQKGKTELQMAEKKAQELIDDAKAEANKIVEKAYVQGKDQVDQMKEKATKEISGLVEQAKKSIEVEKKEMKESLKVETVELVISVTEKILSEKMDQKRDTAYIKELIQEGK